MGEWMGERVRERVGWKNREKGRKKKETEEEMRWQKEGSKREIVKKEDKRKMRSKVRVQSHGTPLPSPHEDEAASLSKRVCSSPPGGPQCPGCIVMRAGGPRVSVCTGPVSGFTD